MGDAHVASVPAEPSGTATNYTLNGWAMDGGTLKIEWDSQQNIEEVKKRILYYTSGCR